VPLFKPYFVWSGTYALNFEWREVKGSTARRSG